jgi:protoheme IX farnesyltransferase
MKPPVDIGEASFAPARSVLSDYLVLIKLRIALMVVFSSLVGYVLGSSAALDFWRLLHTLLATFLLAAGTGALNQFMERERDGLMNRTADRPLPTGRILPEHAYWVGLVLTALGILYLLIGVNGLTALMGALTVGVYLLIYTPMKPKTPHNTAVGAVAGALPPVGGWTAATDGLSAEALALFGILFLWQFPHFLSIAWMYRDDYARGGYRMLPSEDPHGDRTAHQVILYSLVLLSCSLMPALLNMSGPFYFVAAIILGAGVLLRSFAFAQLRTDAAARRLLRATLIYLPGLYLIMVLDKVA